MSAERLAARQQVVEQELRRLAASTAQLALGQIEQALPALAAGCALSELGLTPLGLIVELLADAEFEQRVQVEMDVLRERADGRGSAFAE